MIRPLPILSINDWMRCWKFVDRKSNEECWLWLGNANEAGYGLFWLKGNTYYAHRVIFKIWYNIDPYPLLVCHHCDISSCCNPYHLFLGTYSDNQKDSFAKERNNQKGSQNPQAKLTEEEVKKIHQLFETLSQVKIAELFNVNQSVISNIINGKTWTHVTRAQ